MLKLPSPSAALLLALATLAAPIATRAHAQMPASAETRNEGTVARAFDRWAAGGTGFFEEVLSPDVVWTIKGSGPIAGMYGTLQAQQQFRLEILLYCYHW